MIKEYREAIAVTPLGGGAYSAQITEGWAIGGNVFGGYLAALIGNAISHDLAELGHPHPYAVSAYFLSPSAPGEAIIRVERMRLGKGTSTVEARLFQTVDGVEVERGRVLATFGDLAAMKGDTVISSTPPEMPPIEDCVLTALAPDELKQYINIFDRFQMRLDPTVKGPVGGKPTNKPYAQGWFQHNDGSPSDPISLLATADILPPITIDFGQMGWVPTLELTVYVRAIPAPGPIRVRHECRTYAGGFLEEDCVMYDSEDRLVAQSRQLALAPRPV